MKIENPDWTEKYRPHTIEEVVLPELTKQMFRGFIKDNYIPNLLLAGKSGIGKTTIAKAAMDEMEIDYIIINGSLEGNIDTLRTKITDFATSVSFSFGRKMILIDEADYLNIQSTQPALRNFMETYSKNCGFILTCNYKKRLMKELLSRCTNIDFDIKKSDRPTIAMGYLENLTKILNIENVTFDKKVLADLIMRYFPDYRRVIHECSAYSKINGKIDVGILGTSLEVNFKELVTQMKTKNFNGMRKWVVDNYDADPIMVMRKVYDESNELLKPNSIPEVVVTLAEYQYKHNFVSDPEINLVACLANIMAVALWK